jgi:hypothetical protein
MPTRSPVSLRHEYEQYVEQEIENYKFSLPRAMILRIGDEAVAFLREREQPEFDELVIWAEVDTIIRKRLRLPSYATWRRKRLKLIEKYRRPEHWGLPTDAPLVREIVPDPDTRVLVAGVREEGPVLYLAARGCRVTSLQDDDVMADRVLAAAGEAGLTSRVNSLTGGLDGWAPDAPLNAVVVMPAALARLSDEQRTRAIRILQSATLDGGVHLVATLMAGEAGLTVDELRSRYDGWDVSIVRDGRSQRTFLARKQVA